VIYKLIVTKKVRDTFLAVQNHDYDLVLAGISDSNLTHHFAGNNALGGTRHDKQALERWFKRVGAVLPDLKFEVTDVLVKGPPWNTTVVARWVATTTLLNGDNYVNPGCHVIGLKWGKAHSFDVYEDTQVVTSGLLKQSQSGITEATAPMIES
jgi:ketosteroid isomerase-like protein